MSAPPKFGPATIADLLAIPEEERHHEILDGFVVERGAATPPHGRAQGRLFRHLGPYDRKPGGRSPGGWWFVTEVEIQLESSQVVRPDVAGWRRERMELLPETMPVLVRPDWVCEVLSTNRQHDLIKKKRAFHLHHVEHYWVIDPVDETLTVYRWHPDGYLEVLIADRTQRVRAEPFEGVELSVGMLFGDDDPEP
ncbi:MAG: Uma2 family endonuclease [Myxococcales bacterium]|nr:Uma2 family endonuclease [Myxococcales bacterium]